MKKLSKILMSFGLILVSVGVLFSPLILDIVGKESFMPWMLATVCFGMALFQIGAVLR